MRRPGLLGRVHADVPAGSACNVPGYTKLRRRHVRPARGLPQLPDRLSTRRRRLPDLVRRLPLRRADRDRGDLSGRLLLILHIAPRHLRTRLSRAKPGT